MKMKKIKGYVKKTLSAGIFSAFLLGGGLVYGKNLEEKISKPKVSINFNYKMQDEYKGVDYSTSYLRIVYYPDGIYKNFTRSSNIPKLTLDEENQVRNVISNIQNKNINTPQDLITASQNFSENQKFVLLSVIGELLREFNYDLDLLNSELVSQEEFFYRLQNSLISGDEYGLGVCKHIATHVEKEGEDIGIEKIDTVKGEASEDESHRYVILKGKNGINIIDYGTILTTDTKNTKKALEAYQKYRGIVAFYHNFFDKGKFKYRLKTDDGKRLDDFVRYDETTQNLKKELISGFSKKDKDTEDIKVSLNVEKYLWSMELDLYDWFIKTGLIIGDVSSPLQEMYLGNAGYRKKFSILDNTVNISTELSAISGLIHQDEQKYNDEIFGATGSLSTVTNLEKGFNLALRVAGKGISLGYSKDLSHNFIIENGISLRIPIKNIKIEPYTIMQFSYLPEDGITSEFKKQLSELIAGSIFNIGIKNTTLSFDSYYLWRIWEQGFGGNMKFERKNLELNAEGEATWSSYKPFCPDKVNVGAGLGFKLKNLDLIINYGLEKTNYDGEIDNRHSISIGGRY